MNRLKGGWALGFSLLVVVGREFVVLRMIGGCKECGGC